jgi:hypothetical protein
MNAIEFRFFPDVQLRLRIDPSVVQTAAKTSQMKKRQQAPGGGATPKLGIPRTGRAQTIAEQQMRNCFAKQICGFVSCLNYDQELLGIIYELYERPVKMQAV